MRIRARYAVIAAAALVIGGSAAASANIRIPPLLPLQPYTATTPVPGDIHAVNISDDWGKITVIVGDKTQIVEDGGANLTGPTMSHSVKDGVLTISVACLGAEPYAAGVSVDGVLDLVNNCGDDLKVTIPASASLVAKSAVGDITTTGVNGVQELSAKQGNLSLNDSNSPSIKANTQQGNISLHNVKSAVAIAHTDSQYGYVTIDSCDISQIDASTNEGGVMVKDCSADSVVASAIRGSVDVQDHITPALIQVSSHKGSVSIAVPRGTYALSTHSPDAVLVSEIINDPSATNKLRATTDSGTTTVVGANPA